MPWVAAIVMSGSENKLMLLLKENHSMTSWYPSCVRWTKPKGKSSAIRVEEPAFRGYLFVEKDERIFDVIHSKRYFELLYGYATAATKERRGRLFVIDDDVIEVLKERASMGEFDEAPEDLKKTFRPGDVVIYADPLVGSSFHGNTGIVMESKGNSKWIHVLMGKLVVKVLAKNCNKK